MKVSAQTQIAILITVVLLSAINLNAQNTAQTTEPQSKFVGEISALAQNAKVRRRFRQGFSLQANYTFGKELSDFTGSTTSNSSFISQRDPDYEFIAQNPYHVFKANFLYQLPFGKGKEFFNRGGISNVLLGGFQIGAIVRAESGDILTITSGLGTLNRAGRSAGNAVDVVSGASLSDLRGQIGARTDANARIVFFDADFANNFANPQPGTLGNLGRGRFEGPGFFTTDFSVIKRIPITERQNIEFRAEFFNVFNNVNFSNPSAVNLNFNSSNFGVIDNIRGNPRIVQFALWYNF